MKTKVVQIEEVSLIARDGWHSPFPTINAFPDACGAGNGLQEKLVPDNILGCRIAAACDIHDDMFYRGEPTWADYHQANSVFFHNISSIIRCRSMPGMRFLRILVVASYFEAVDTLGSLAYKAVKFKQGYTMS